MKHLLQVTISIVFMALFTGCMDGPFYALKRVNPYYMSRWNADRKHGATFEDRLEELQAVQKQLPTMDQPNQEKWAERLEEIVRNDASPEMRSEAIRILAQLSSPTAERALNTASTDEVEKVRLAACKAWRRRGGNSARDMLLSMAQADESSSVRQAAVTSLAGFNEPEVVRALGNLLEDSSPAIQYNVAESLANITGQQYGGDIEGWKQFINSSPAAETVPNATDPSTLGLGGIPVLNASGPIGLPQLP